MVVGDKCKKNNKMKYIILVTIVWFSFSINQCLCQSFINGDFEFNTSVGCDYNLIDSVFNTRISNVTAFGKGYAGSPGGYVGEIDIQTSGCYITPQNGNWCLGLASDTLTTSDAITIELDSSLSAGINYKLSFYIYGNTSFNSTMANIEIGETLSDTLFGILIDSITPDTNNWKFVSLTFTAAQNSNYISVRAKAGKYGWTQIDNFSISPSTMTSIEENNTKPKISVYPNPANTAINIRMEEDISSGFVSIINLSGQLLRKQEINSGQNFNFDLTTIPSGVYFMIIESDQFSDCKRFIRK